MTGFAISSNVRLAPGSGPLRSATQVESEGVYALKGLTHLKIDSRFHHHWTRVHSALRQATIGSPAAQNDSQGNRCGF
jgi:hypothetical protein